MPKPRRESAARADTRPAFNRPPNSRPAPAPAIRLSQSDEEGEYDEPRTPKRAPKEKAKASPVPSPSPEKRPRRPSDRYRSSSGVKDSPRREKQQQRDRAKYSSGTSTNSGSQLLSSDALAKLNAYNDRADFEEKYEERRRNKKKQKQYKNLKAAEQRKRKHKNRNVSGAILEEGRVGEKHRRAHGRGGGYGKEYQAHRRSDTDDGRRKKRLWWLVILVVVLLAIFIPVAVVVSNNSKKSSGGSSSSSATTSGGSSSISNDCAASSIPASAKGTYTDISTWMDTADFNCTYTAETVGGLSVMGLYSSWDDSTKANDNVPALNEQWEYGKMPIRGVNIGGWLSLEPFITPSIFNYPASAKVVDEWTLTQKLGPSAQRVIETHYATFITKQSFVDIKNAGLDHVRIPYPYWSVTTYDGDPYVPKIAWRYLLRAIEYCRENGLRVNLDLHSVPGSQNGWAHSGHQGDIGWILGPDGATNAQRSLDIHNQLSQFFAQDRYKNVVTIYGLVNEPKMLVIPPQSVLDWNQKAIAIIRGNGVKQRIVFGDGFLSLNSWDNMFHGVDDNLVMDTHQYQIFNTGQLKLKHQDKINLACSGWTGLMVAANNPQTGWGPTLDGEWSQADTDCTPNLNNVGVGSRWAGTLDTGDPGTSVLTPTCAEPPCSCAEANADPSQYSAAYKQFLQMYAEAQMHSFEQAWGWFYWTWKTESAVQWSWMLGLEAGILPDKAYSPSFKCDSAVPDFSDLPESY
ncbi:glucan 1,3-beta-glucosidase [Cladophialophora psammophila CBS 110553]|uniref:glucan 1,3-beta-glucosidase n=1 Tax=Cladophialophora psammophila CBS 110553 TaxID=1182543 RepID=W9WXY7_9EURO|nr:glucan 1,3-beta-glucosidase [Cladophialophora psammophila CBS 110553]EXJ72823.1 glucan 1,3-beta-glucosidase [Cladophialophora psammophila CBS 110553]